MARRPIHPGEHLAEELEALGMSAAELGRQIEVPINRVDRHPQRPTRHYGRYSSAAGPFLWHESLARARHARLSAWATP
jgi:hypothetical protein